MRKNHLLSVASVVAALLLGGTTGVAVAAPTPVTCAQANAAVAVGQDRVQNEAADVREAEDNLQASNDNLTEAIEALDSAVLGGALEVVLAPLRAAVDNAEESRDANQRALDAERAELREAQADLAELVNIQERACAPAATTTPPPPPVDKDCDDFLTQKAAQAVLDLDKADPNGLDANKNGVACEEFFPPVTSTVNPPPAIVGDDVIGEDNDIDIRVNVPEVDNDTDDGVRFRPNTSGGIATG